MNKKKIGKKLVIERQSVRVLKGEALKEAGGAGKTGSPGTVSYLVCSKGGASCDCSTDPCADKVKSWFGLCG